jgi:hypothetical protein
MRYIPAIQFLPASTRLSYMRPKVSVQIMAICVCIRDPDNMLLYRDSTVLCIQCSAPIYYSRYTPP